MSMTRREWLQAGIASVGGVVAAGWADFSLLPSALAAEDSPGPWEIGCFNRPWGRWTYDEALDGIKQAGYRLTGLVGGHAGEAFIAPEATNEYLDKLKERIAVRGLLAIVAWYHTDHNIPIEESIRRSRRQIDNAQRIGLRFLMSGAVGDPAQYDHYYKVMADAAAYGADRGVQIVVKPHGGCAASSDELQVCLEKVNHPNFRIWYDGGNIIHYTGKDPVAEAEKLAKVSTGFCAKDCAAPKGDVMIQFGDGKVDFKGIFAKLRQADFKGPVMVECCSGKSKDEVTAAAKANREFLERSLKNG